jgi:exopolysaccharide biosynthesis predicted pyruvyltransferase EpsI
VSDLNALANVKLLITSRKKNTLFDKISACRIVCINKIFIKVSEYFQSFMEAVSLV